MAIEKVGKGVEYSISEKYITLRIERKGNHGLSGSGKSITVATTSGAINVEGIQINLNAYVANPKYKKGQTPSKPRPKAEPAITIM